MNKNVLEFPTRLVRDWIVIERAIRERCSRSMFPPEAERHLLEVMKPFWEILDPELHYSFDVAFPDYVKDGDKAAIQADVGSSISRMNSDILQRFTRRLFAERMEREIQWLRESGQIP